MPEINIPAKARFILYLLAVLGGLFVQYAIDKTWFGEAEFRLWSGIATLLMLLAAAKTNLTNAVTTVKGMVVSETGETGAIDATLSTENTLPEATSVDLAGEEGDDGLSYEEAGGRPYENDYGYAPSPSEYPKTGEDGDPSRY